ncbi:MAG TPA: FUSC family protein [Streptosporangiaceae bacterium]
MPGDARVPVPRPARRAGRRLLSDLRGGRAFLASELTQSSWHDFGAFRWRDMAGAQAVRAAIGVLVPLVAGVATNHVEYGSYAALGALPAGFVSFRGVNRTRVAAVLAAAAGMAVSTFVGGTAAEGLPWALIPIVLIWGYATGLLAAIGPTALVVTLQWPVALLVASAIPLEPGPAAIRAGLVLAGGLWQCLLVVSSWVTGRGGAERAAMAESFRSLSKYAADLAAGRQGPPAPADMPGTQALTDPNPLLRTVARQHLLDLVTEAERIRATLTALGAYRPDGVPSLAGRRFLTGAAEVLDHVAGTMTGRPRQRTIELAAARHVLAGLSAETGTSWQWSGEALLGQLRAACRIAGRLIGGEPGRRKGRGTGRWRHQATTQTDIALTLRASLGASSEAGRHAIRLAVVAATAELIALASGLSHGYWAVLTVFIVLRPDYSSTVYRGMQRAVGTIVGAGLGVATVLLDHVGRSVLLAGIGVSLLAAYAVFTVNYLLYGVFLTDFVVVLLALLGLPPVPTALARLAGTGVGAGLALLAYVAWPSWGGTSASEKFAELISAQGRYAAAVLRSYAAPPGAARPRLGPLQVAARRTRIDADAAADRLAGEPDHPPMTAALASALVAATHETAAACLTLTAAATAHEPEESDAALESRLDRLAAGIEQATGQIAAALRELGEDAEPARRPALPALRTLQREIWAYRGATADASPHRPPGDEEAGLISATDSLVDAINTTAHVLGFPT